jgi:hypothetical protein
MKATKSTINKASKLAELIADKKVWEYFCEEHKNSLDTLCEKVVETNEGGYLMGHLDIGFMASAADSRGELSSLVIEGLSRIPLEDRMSLLRDIRSVPGLDKYRSSRNRSTMIEILGLREWATKEDIIKSLSEVL